MLTGLDFITWKPRCLLALIYDTFFTGCPSQQQLLTLYSSKQHWATGFSVPQCYDHFIVLLIDDISASPWAPNAPAAVQ